VNKKTSVLDRKVDHVIFREFASGWKATLPTSIFLLYGVIYFNIANFDTTTLVTIAILGTTAVIIAGYILIDHLRSDIDDEDYTKYLNVKSRFNFLHRTYEFLYYFPTISLFIILGDENVVLLTIACTDIVLLFFVLRHHSANNVVISTCVLVAPSLIYLFEKGGDFHHQILLIQIMFSAIIIGLSKNSIKTRKNTIKQQFLIEEQKELAENANIAKSKFLATASHDLRQPLQALVLFVNVLKQKQLEPSTEKIVNNIDDSLLSLSELFNVLLDLSKLDAGTIKPSIRTISLEKLFTNLFNEYEPQAKLGNIKLEYLHSDYYVLSDILLLERILRNLISNSIRYTERGKITFSAKQIDSNVSISISDTGVGIPENQQENVFNEFTQLDNDNRNGEHGMGLGLSIVSRLCDLLDIPITLKSELTKGTCVTLVLKMADKQLKGKALSVDQKSNILLGKNIIVIDDDENIRLGIMLLLQSWECNPIVAESEEDALKTIQTKNVVPDAIIVDYQLRNNKTGLNFVNTMLDIYRKPIPTPTLIITGETSPELLKILSNSGHLYLHKPVKAIKLRAAIHHLLAH